VIKAQPASLCSGLPIVGNFCGVREFCCSAMGKPDFIAPLLNRRDAERL
jgi:hypothetical protein